MSAVAELPFPVTKHSPTWTSLADVAASFGDIPARRIRFTPYPGTATEADCLRVTETERPCELIEGTLVEKAVGVPEAYLAQTIGFFIMSFVRPRRLGIVVGADGLFRMYRGNIRMPDVSFTRRDRLPNPFPQIGGWCPDLCVEVLSPDNTRGEMRRKRKEYFASGCQLMWILDRQARTCEVYANEFECLELGREGILDGGSVLPGFVLPMSDIFFEYDEIFPPVAP